MTTKEHAEKLARALEATGLAQPVNATHAENRIQVLCRVPPGNEEKWIKLIETLLIASLDEAKELHAWQNHICRNYFIKELENGSKKLVWGWNVSIQSKEMGHSLNLILRLLRGEPIRVVPNRELTEFPLHGATASRNAPKNGKGVHTVGDKDFHPARTK